MSGERPDVRIDAAVSGDARATIAGRDIHVHYEDGPSRARRSGTPQPDVRCPYPGLAAFTTAQSHWFFGRDALVASLVERAAESLDEGGPLVVVAPSGAGKSSLLQAGLLAAIRRGALPVAGSARWPQLVLTPTSRPVAALERGLAALGPRLAGQRLIVVVDQLEELFTLCGDVHARRRFLELLAGLPDALVVFGLRIDAYAHCTAHPFLRKALQDGQVLVGPMTEDELRQAVVFPARQVGLELEPGLPDLLLRDLGTAGDSGYEAGRLPLLAHALRAAWRERHGHVLTVAGYRAAGGIRNAIATTAERVHAGLGPAGQNATRSLFLRLVHIGDGIEDGRRTVAVDDLRHAAAALDAFTDARLLTRAQDTVTITHEALLRAWPRLRDWIDENRAGNLLVQKLQEAALAWEGDDRDPALLWRGNRLEAVRVLVAENRLPGDLNDREQAFLDACLALEQQQRAAARRRTRRLKQFIAVLAALVLVLAGTAAYAVIAERRADAAKTRAVAHEAAMKAVSLIATKPELAVAVAHAAYRVASTPETRDALLSAHLAASRIPLHDRPPHHGAPVRISRGGRTVISKDIDGTPVLWRMEADRAVPAGRFSGVNWTPGSFYANGSVAVIGDFSVTELWGIGDSAGPRLQTTLPRSVNARFISEDGRILDGVMDRVRGRVLLDLADLQAPEEIALPCADGDSLVRPDGRALATACPDPGGKSSSTVTIWTITDQATLTPLTTIPLGRSAEHVLAYGSKGETILVSDPSRGQVRIWDVTGEPRPLGEVDLDGKDRGHSLSFDDEHRVLVTKDAVEVHFWSLSVPANPHRFASVRTVYPVTPMPVHRPQFNDYIYSDGLEIWLMDPYVERVEAKICGRPELRLKPGDWQRYLPDVDQVPVCP